MVLVGDLLTGHLKKDAAVKLSAPESQSNEPPSDIYQLGWLWAQLIKNSTKISHPFSSYLGKPWNVLVESMMTSDPAERPDIHQVIKSLASIDEHQAEALMKPMKPDISLLFEGGKEEQKPLLQVWKA